MSAISDDTALPAHTPHREGGGPVLLRDTRDVAATIEAFNSDGSRLLAPGRHRVQGQVRVAFEHRGEDPGKVLLLADVDSYIISYPIDGVETEILLRYRALYAPEGSRDRLQDFLRAELHIAIAEPDGFMRRDDGWFYKFPDDYRYEAALTESNQWVEVSGAAIERRLEQRVAVRQEIQWSVGGAVHNGMAYNVSRGGIYVMSAGAVPDHGMEVTIPYPIANPDKPPLLTGVVCWRQEGMGATGGGFCLQLNHVEDGDSGETWARYVEGQAGLAD
ncbi:MAG: hypothetical protein ACI9WU_001290 [Myxococcota bacterium]|jgi:hypothetical protein